MGQDGIPISLAIVIAAAIIGATALIGMLFLAIFPALIG
jgi:hypothetical protein